MTTPHKLFWLLVYLLAALFAAHVLAKHVRLTVEFGAPAVRVQWVEESAADKLLRALPSSRMQAMRIHLRAPSFIRRAEQSPGRFRNIGGRVWSVGAQSDTGAALPPSCRPAAPDHLTADGADAADKGPGRRASVSVPSALSVVKMFLPDV
jgi:hypothetical protein